MHFRESARIQPIYASEKSFNYVGNIKKRCHFDFTNEYFCPMTVHAYIYNLYTNLSNLAPRVEYLKI